MKKGITVGREVLIFYHPIETGFTFSNFDIFVKGIVTSWKRTKDGYIYYKAIDKEGVEYIGMHKMISESNYFFITYY